MDSEEVLMNWARRCLVEVAGFSGRAERFPGFPATDSFLTEEEVFSDFFGKELFRFSLSFFSIGLGGKVGWAPERWRTWPAGYVSYVFKAS